MRAQIGLSEVFLSHPVCFPSFFLYNIICFPLYFPGETPLKSSFLGSELSRSEAILGGRNQQNRQNTGILRVY